MPTRRVMPLSVDQHDVPEMGDPDRKRMLNVLAQRRYRQRQREKLNRNPSKDKNVTLQPLASTSSPVNEFGASPIPSTTISMPMLDNFYDTGNPLIGDDSFSQPHCTLDLLSNIAYDSSTSSGAFGSMPASLPVYSPSDFSAELSELSDLELSQFTFSDTLQINIPAIKLHNVGMTIAGLLDCADTIYDPTFTRTITAAQFSPLLPPNLMPTPIQGQIPHHPVLDVLPWPSVRTKLIVMFSQPVHLRPPIARDEMGMMRLVEDLDDETDGVRIANNAGNDADALDERSWEIGQTFFKNWWWALDSRLVERSNRLRRDRGARPLTLKDGT